MRTPADNPWPVVLLTVPFVVSLIVANGCSGDRREAKGLNPIMRAPYPPSQSMPDDLTTQVRDISRLTLAEARGLEGKLERYTVTIEPRDEGFGPYRVVGCASDDDLSRTAWLPAGPRIAGVRLTIEGDVKVLEHRAKKGFPGFTEVRLFGVVVEE